MSEVPAEALALPSEYSWKSEVLVDWKRANIMSFLQKGKKEGPENYRPISLSLIHGDDGHGVGHY